MTFLNRGRPIFGAIGRPSEPAPEPVAQAAGLPVAAPAPADVTDDLRAAVHEVADAVRDVLDQAGELRGSQRISALAFNAVSRSLGDVFVRLGHRADIATAVLNAVLSEHERQVRSEVSAEILAAKDNLPPGLPINAVMPLLKGIDIAAAIARGDR